MTSLLWQKINSSNEYDEVIEGPYIELLARPSYKTQISEANLAATSTKIIDKMPENYFQSIPLLIIQKYILLCPLNVYVLVQTIRYRLDCYNNVVKTQYIFIIHKDN